MNYVVDTNVASELMRPSAFLCAELHEQALSRGKVPTIEDLTIAAICKRNDCVLATRNVKDFDYLAIDVVNPFES